MATVAFCWVWAAVRAPAKLACEETMPPTSVVMLFCCDDCHDTSDACDVDRARDKLDCVCRAPDKTAAVLACAWAVAFTKFDWDTWDAERADARLDWVC